MKSLRITVDKTKMGPRFWKFLNKILDKRPVTNFLRQRDVSSKTGRMVTHFRPFFFALKESPIKSKFVGKRAFIFGCILSTGSLFFSDYFAPGTPAIGTSVPTSRKNYRAPYFVKIYWKKKKNDYDNAISSSFPKVLPFIRVVISVREIQISMRFNNSSDSVIFFVEINQ